MQIYFHQSRVFMLYCSLSWFCFQLFRLYLRKYFSFPILFLFLWVWIMPNFLSFISTTLDLLQVRLILFIRVCIIRDCSFLLKRGFLDMNSVGSFMFYFSDGFVFVGSGRRVVLVRLGYRKLLH